MTFTCQQFLASRELGGAGLTALQLADFARQRGATSCVWSLGEGPALDKTREMGLSHRVFDPADIMNGSRLSALIGNVGLARALRRMKPGIVHLQSPVQYGAMRHGLGLSGLIRVVHVHLEEDVSGLTWGLRRPPELIVTCARFLVEHVRRTLPEPLRARQRIVAVPNAVNTARYCPGDKQEAKRVVGAPSDRPLILMLANLAPHKGQMTAVRATAELRANGMDAECWLAGVERDGSLSFTAQLAALISELGLGDRVRLLGHRSDTVELLRAADVFLLPSTLEGLPLSVLEAQATRLPVVAAPTSGIPEVVADGETGFLVPAHDCSGYASRIRDLLRNPDLHCRIAHHAYAKVVRDHNWMAYCERIWELYLELMEADTWNNLAVRVA